MMEFGKCKDGRYYINKIDQIVTILEGMESVDIMMVLIGVMSEFIGNSIATKDINYATVVLDELKDSVKGILLASDFK